MKTISSACVAALLGILSLLASACGSEPVGTPPEFEARLPAAGDNNLWYSNTPGDTVVVFVHGILSDSRSCWWYQDSEDRSKNKYWPELVKNDSSLGKPAVYLAGYYADVDSGIQTIRDASKEIWQGLTVAKGGPSLLASRKRILFVSHSTGGIVLRYMLEDHADELRDKIVGVMLIASPSGGSESANALSDLIDFYENELGRTLMTGSQILEDIDRRFKDLVAQNKIPFLAGAEAFEHHRIVHYKWLPPLRMFERLRLVTRESASHYFGDATLLQDTDHFGTVKPDSEKHAGYRLLLEFYQGNFAKVSKRAASVLDHPIVASDRVIEIDARNVSQYADAGDLEAHRLVLRDVVLSLRPRAVVQVNEIEMIGGAGIAGTDITLRVGNMTGGRVTADGADGAPGKPGGEGGRLNIAGMTITGTSLSARGGNGGNALKPDTPGSEGGAGGIVFVASANTFDPPPNVNGGKGGLTAGRPGTPGRAVIQRFADAARANLFAQARETFQLNAALASAAPPADTPAVAINFVGSSDLSAETLKSLEAVVGSLQRDAALGVVLMPAGGQTVDAKLQLERSDAVLGYLLEKGVDPGQITASSDTKVDRAVGGLPVSGGAAWLTTIPGTIQQF